MKKILLSGALIIVFVVYVWQQHLSGSGMNFSVKNSSNKVAMPVSNVVYKDGQYTGTTADAYYGNIQVVAVIQGGKITDVQFLNYPQDRSTSIQISKRAMPILKSEAIAVQSARVDAVSGATDTSKAFVQSLTSALNQAV